MKSTELIMWVCIAVMIAFTIGYLISFLDQSILAAIKIFIKTAIIKLTYTRPVFGGKLW